ncbi:hypothetical protein D3C77_466360 [compost metagenome]
MLWLLQQGRTEFFEIIREALRNAVMFRDLLIVLAVSPFGCHISATNLLKVGISDHQTLEIALSGSLGRFLSNAGQTMLYSGNRRKLIQPGGDKLFLVANRFVVLRFLI